MESSGGDGAPSPCSHHHHHRHCHLHHHRHCHLHHHHHHHHHHCSSNQHVSPRLVHRPHFHNPVPDSHVPWPHASNSEVCVPEPVCDSGLVVFEEHERTELEEEEDEEPIFVMTDEWKEFFAKSEAKRKLEKKQAKKKGKT